MRLVSFSLSRFPLGALCAALALCACQRAGHGNEAAASPPTATGSTETAAFTWPASLHPFGDGYPQPGDPCRRLGESPAVADFLDHTQVLVGCPGPADRPPAATLISDGNGKMLTTIDGVTVITLPPNSAL